MIVPLADLVDAVVLMDLQANFKYIYTQITVDYETVKGQLARHRLLYNAVACPGCQLPMRHTKKQELKLAREQVRAVFCAPS
uniref:Uncharacterized protein n=1 Tax=Plectus sambesii TaxID=2011161 RepID=A0A914VLG0_9BILA